MSSVSPSWAYIIVTWDSDKRTNCTIFLSIYQLRPANFAFAALNVKLSSSITSFAAMHIPASHARHSRPFSTWAPPAERTLNRISPASAPNLSCERLDRNPEFRPESQPR
jgi:hypothetical protein